MAADLPNFLVLVTSTDDIDTAWDILNDIGVEVEEEDEDEAVSTTEGYGAGCSFDKADFLAAAEAVGLSARVVNAYSA